MDDRQQTSCRTHGSSDMYCITECNARMSSSCPTRKFSFSASPKEALRPNLKGVDSVSNMYMRGDSTDISDVLDEGEASGMMLKMPRSQNLVSEPKRRKKMNERLYSLRVLVPNISENLQNQVDMIQEDIVDLATHKKGAAIAGAGDEDPDEDPRRNNFAVSFQKQIKLEHRIEELEVSQMEEHIYHLRIHCKKTPGVLVQLTRALEALELEILNANISSVDDHILNSAVVEVKNGLVVKTDELRNMALAVVPKFGFSFCGKRCS